MHTIIGAGGNVGNLLAKDLNLLNKEIKLVSRNPKQVNKTDKLFAADMLDRKAMKSALSNTEVAYLVAGLPYKTKIWEEEWMACMRSVIDACKLHGSKLVFFDNMYMYNPAFLDNLTEETPIKPVSRKGMVRAKVAQYLLDQISIGNIDGMVVRSADFYGPEANNSVLTSLVINKLKDGKAAQWLYNDDKIHNFTYLPDAVKAISYLVDQKDSWNQIWHLPTTNERLTIKEIVALTANLINKPNKLNLLSPSTINLLGLFISNLREVKEMSYQLKENYFFNSDKIASKYGLYATPYAEAISNCLNKTT